MIVIMHALPMIVDCVMMMIIIQCDTIALALHQINLL